MTSSGSKLVARLESSAGRFVKVAEDFDALFEFRRSILTSLQERQIPYVEEEIPIVLAWYPEVDALYIWNISNTEKTFHIRRGDRLTGMKLGALDSQVIDLKTLN